jgi:hypothetical protein
MRRLSGLLAIALLSSVFSLHAADLSGFWLGSAASGGRRNLVQDVAFQFIQKGAILTGKLYVDYGSTPILKGTIDGDKFTFQVVAREQAGNEINESVFRFTGTLKDGEIEMTRDREEIRTAVNSAAAFARPGSLTFKLKRLP